MLDGFIVTHAESQQPLQQAQVHATCMACAVSIGVLLNRMHGGTSETFAAEQTIIKAYQKKVQKAVAGEELEGLKKKTEINIDAAHRFINHAIPELSQEQKQKLRQVCLSNFEQVYEYVLT